jgi:hypothetical protein
MVGPPTMKKMDSWLRPCLPAAGVLGPGGATRSGTASRGSTRRAAQRPTHGSEARRPRAPVTKAGARGLRKLQPWRVNRQLRQLDSSDGSSRGVLRRLTRSPKRRWWRRGGDGATRRRCSRRPVPSPPGRRSAATRTGTVCPLPPGVKHHLRTTASRPVQRPAGCQDPTSTAGSPLAHVTSRVACGVAASAADGGTSPWSGAFALRQRF